MRTSTCAPWWRTFHPSAARRRPNGGWIKRSRTTLTYAAPCCEAACGARLRIHGGTAGEVHGCAPRDCCVWYEQAGGRRCGADLREVGHAGRLPHATSPSPCPRAARRRSHVVEQLLLHAHSAGRRFRVVVVDAAPRLEGKQLLMRLAGAGVPCSYLLINAVSYAMKARPRRRAAPARRRSSRGRGAWCRM